MSGGAVKEILFCKGLECATNFYLKSDDLIKMQRNNCKLVTFQNTFQIIYKSINIILLKSLFTH